MKNYRLIETNEIIPHNELRAAFPHVSFAPELDQEILNLLGLQAMPDVPPPASTPDEQRTALKQAVTDLRWQRETGGLTLPGGIKVGTTTEDQNRITSVIANAALAGVETVDFKAESGWVTLAIEQVQALAGAIALHVQACFSAERLHHEAIDALADAALADYDVATGWPANA